MGVHASLEGLDVVPPLQHADDGQLAATDGGHLGLGFGVRVGVGATPKRLSLSRTADGGHLFSEP